MSDFQSPETPSFQRPEDPEVPFPSGSADTYSASLSSSSGLEGAPVTITYVADGPTTAPVTPAMAGLAGAFSAGSIALNGTTPVSLTFTPSGLGTGTLSSTNSGALTDPGSQSYTSTSGGGLLEYIPTAQYLIAYTSEAQFRQGANGPLVFIVFRSDGGAVAMPTISVCNVVAPDQSVLSADAVNPSAPSNPAWPTVYAASTSGSTILEVGVLIGTGGFSQVGTYEIDLELSWGGVIASTPSQITIVVGP
jgi:hypothetical protein